MNKTEIIEQVEKLYNAAAELGDISLETDLHDILIDNGPVGTAQVYPVCKRIEDYEVLDQWLIVGSFNAVCLYLAINNGQRAYLTCEGNGGAVVLWFENPSDDYEDRMSLIWNLTEQKHGVGYVTEPAGAFDQWIFPADNITDDDGIGQNAVEQELYEFIKLLADMLC